MVTVDLHPNEEQRLVLYIRDDGVGIPPGFDLAGTSTLGLKLVSNLASQVGGRFEMKRPTDGGVEFRVVFPIPQEKIYRGES